MEMDGIKELFSKISKSSKDLFEPVWEVFETYWNKLTKTEQQKWSIAFLFIKNNIYKKQLDLYEEGMENSLFPETLKKTINELRN
jgi:hypothetical protein